MSKTIIVSNRLPVRIEREGDTLNYKSSEGGLATGLGSIYKEGSNVWIGWPGASFDSEELKQEVTQGLKKESMHPVFLTEDEVQDFYLGFSNQTLWPAFHYFMQYVDYEQSNWDSYETVNRKFADAILSVVEPGDVVWVHDYQLLLVPGMLRGDVPDITIGFFQHIPFPSYEVFRTLPWRRLLLNGMLGSDYIAFHTYDDMRHFLSSVHRITGYPYQGGHVQLRDRTVVVDSLPMGIDYNKYAENAVHPESLEREQKYRGSLGDTRLILSMDRLDYSKGIPDRIKAFDKFLEENPQYREKVSLFLVVVPSRDKVPNYQALKEHVDEWVGKVNSKYGRVSWRPIHYFYRSYPFRALGAFYRMCDIAMITPLRDGMNLVCKEFVASRNDADGVLILSEMAGASKELSDAILVNPFDRDQLVSALVQALEMPENEQRKHMKAMQATVQKYDIFNWVKLFFNNLENAKALRESLVTQRMEGENQRTLLASYEQAEKRLLFLDYDGTLVDFNSDPEACAPDESLQELIRKLVDNPRNTVVVISGRKRETLEAWFSELDVKLVAEHGIWVRDEDHNWVSAAADEDDEWKGIAREIMEFYVDRTPGTFIEEKAHSLAWHYRKAEAGLGNVRKSELTSHLRHMLSEHHCQLLDGHLVVEVKPDVVNKGVAAHRIYHQVKPDFSLCIGDDVTDEDMFRALPQETYTIKVGPGHSRARYAIDSTKEVHGLLRKLV